MNTKNNRRRQDSVQRIEQVFMELLAEKELRQITVSDICKEAQLNRSTFYANFLDVYDLADRIRDRLEEDFNATFQNTAETHPDAVMMFRHIQNNQLLYRTYFKLGYPEKQPVLVYDRQRARQDFGDRYIPYHIEFFRCGLNAIIRMWLAGGCKESPEEMAQILTDEYGGRRLFGK